MPRFAPGQSGNPGGRPRDAALRRAARDALPVAIFALIRVCCDAQAAPDVQLRAAALLIERGWGAGGKQASGYPAAGHGRWPCLRSRTLALLDMVAWHTPDGDIRRQVLALLDEHERVEGLTEGGPVDLV